jgi:hypothetical protein
MTRSFFAVLFVGVAGVALFPMSLQGCSQTGVGDPCVPEQEYDPTFRQFTIGEVNVESKSFDCQTRLCLANHFQGRVTCPYGQTIQAAPRKLNGSVPYTDKNGAPIGSCVLPGGGQDDQSGKAPAGQDVYGNNKNPAPGVAPTAEVLPQRLDRTANQAVYCSCRCANVNNQTNDGAVYCACPDGFACTQLVAPVQAGVNEGLTGAYCIKKGTDFDALATPKGTCDPAQKNCGTFNGQ